MMDVFMSLSNALKLKRRAEQQRLYGRVQGLENAKATPDKIARLGRKPKG